MCLQVQLSHALPTPKLSSLTLLITQLRHHHLQEAFPDLFSLPTLKYLFHVSPHLASLRNLNHRMLHLFNCLGCRHFKGIDRGFSPSSLRVQRSIWGRSKDSVNRHGRMEAGVKNQIKKSGTKANNFLSQSS